MPYSTADDPKMDRCRTLEQSEAEVKAERERVRNFTERDAMEIRLKRIRTVHGRIDRQKREARAIREECERWRKSNEMHELRKSMRADTREYKRNRGMIAPRYGDFDEDATQTARFDRLNLDPGSDPRGGHFDDSSFGGVNGPGRFVPKATKKSKTDPTPRREPTLDEIERGMTDEGPRVPGCSWSSIGPGSWPGGGVSRAEDPTRPDDPKPQEEYQEPNPTHEWTSWGKARRQSHSFDRGDVK